MNRVEQMVRCLILLKLSYFVTNGVFADRFPHGDQRLSLLSPRKLRLILLKLLILVHILSGLLFDQLGLVRLLLYRQ